MDDAHASRQVPHFLLNLSYAQTMLHSDAMTTKRGGCLRPPKYCRVDILDQFVSIELSGSLGLLNHVRSGETATVVEAHEGKCCHRERLTLLPPIFFLKKEKSERHTWYT
ncbi:hypothetical protein C0Q70_13723 [Pomacea canaliculata]|uniref:Uncharacterized protein n=1 Tax=Pomacea canaliculata TaxID=400727 RepID=A0A2T7NY04_POMCA|nr:hypothetical protein C0Q70_13723 [Pomacea canaliculata]